MFFLFLLSLLKASSHFPMYDKCEENKNKFPTENEWLDFYEIKFQKTKIKWNSFSQHKIGRGKTLKGESFRFYKIENRTENLYFKEELKKIKKKMYYFSIITSAHPGKYIRSCYVNKQNIFFIFVAKDETKVLHKNYFIETSLLERLNFYKALTRYITTFLDHKIFFIYFDISDVFIADGDLEKPIVNSFHTLFSFSTLQENVNYLSKYSRELREATFCYTAYKTRLETKNTKTSLKAIAKEISVRNILKIIYDIEEAVLEKEEKNLQNQKYISFLDYINPGKHEYFSFPSLKDVKEKIESLSKDINQKKIDKKLKASNLKLLKVFKRKKSLTATLKTIKHTKSF